MAVQASIHLPGKASVSSEPYRLSGISSRQWYYLDDWHDLDIFFDDTARMPRFYLQEDGIPYSFEDISPYTLSTCRATTNENNVLYLWKLVHQTEIINAIASAVLQSLRTADRKYIVTTMTAAQTWFKFSNYWMTIGSLIWHLWQIDR